MKALFKRAMSGEGSCIHMSMFESSVSWLTTPITLGTTFGQTISRRGNTHEFFCPVSVYKTADGYVYLAVGNDRQWKAMVSQDIFKRLDRIEYETNAGRIADVDNLNRMINNVTINHINSDLISLFSSISVPISEIKEVPEVVKDPLVKQRLLSAEDPKTGMRLTLAPPPNMTPFLKKVDRKLTFPPRFGEHNRELYGTHLGYSDNALAELKTKGVI
jgi:formyl-CoA transferase